MRRSRRCAPLRATIEASAMKNDLDHVQSVLGSAELVSKCHEVTTNWSRKRDQMTKKLDAVAKASAGFRSLKDTWADTTTPHGRLKLTVLGGLAEFERALIRARTGEGRSRAKARGVRPPKLTVHQRQEAF